MGNWKRSMGQTVERVANTPAIGGWKEVMEKTIKNVANPPAPKLPPLPPPLPDLSDATIRAAAYSERQKQMGQGRRSTFLNLKGSANPNDTRIAPKSMTVLGG